MVQLYVFTFLVLSCCLLFVQWYLNAIFNNISAISWRSILLVKETGGPGENHRPVASQWKTLSPNVVHLALIEIRTHNSRGIYTDSIRSCKSNYHTITAMMEPVPSCDVRYNSHVNRKLGSSLLSLCFVGGSCLCLCHLHLFKFSGVQHDFHVTWCSCCLTVTWCH